MFLLKGREKKNSFHFVQTKENNTMENVLTFDVYMDCVQLMSDIDLYLNFSEETGEGSANAIFKTERIGERYSNHAWNKFNAYGRDVTKFIIGLDPHRIPTNFMGFMNRQKSIHCITPIVVKFIASYMDSYFTILDIDQIVQEHRRAILKLLYSIKDGIAGRNTMAMWRAMNEEEHKKLYLGILDCMTIETRDAIKRNQIPSHFERMGYLVKEGLFPLLYGSEIIWCHAPERTYESEGKMIYGLDNGNVLMTYLPHDNGNEDTFEIHNGEIKITYDKSLEEKLSALEFTDTFTEEQVSFLMDITLQGLQQNRVYGKRVKTLFKRMANMAKK